MQKSKTERIGEKRTMNCGLEAEIIEYKTQKDIYVKFSETNEICKADYSNFINGRIKSHFSPTVYNKGIIGLEKTRDEKHKMLKEYKMWVSMLTRCYDIKYQIKEPSYKGCEVCEEWLNFSIFKKWYYENYYEFENENMQLDKDILHKGNKIYSPKYCIFVPQRINSLFIKRDSKRGEYPIGTSYHKRDEKYSSTCRILSKSKFLGYFNTPEEAFNAYKKEKEKYIKEVADEYKDKIPQKLYDAMYKYEIEITD